MTYVGCTGSESRLIDCSYSSATSTCSHAEDAGVQCQTSSLSFQLRIKEGLSIANSTLVLLSFCDTVPLSSIFIANYYQAALLAVSVPLADQRPLRVGLRSVSVVSGAPSVITPGLKSMPTLSAGNLDTPIQVIHEL